MKPSEEKPIQLKSYDIISLNQTVAELGDWVNQPNPESYCACKNHFAKVMEIMQNRRYTLVWKEIEQQDSHTGKELMDRQDAVVHAGASLCESYSKADDDIFKSLTGRLGPVPGYSIVMEAYHGSETDNLGKAIRRLRQSVSDLITELQNVIEKSAAGDAEAERKSRRQEKGGQSNIGAIVISLIMVLLFELFVYIAPVSYFRNHPRTYVIQAITACLIFCFIIGFFMRRSRKWWWALAGTFLAALLSVL